MSVAWKNCNIHRDVPMIMVIMMQGIMLVLRWWWWSKALWCFNEDAVPRVDLKWFTDLSANMKKLTRCSNYDDNVPMMVIMFQLWFHLEWFTVLPTNMKDLCEVSDKGNRVLYWFWEGVDLFPGFQLFIFDHLMFRHHVVMIITLQATQGLQEAHCAELQLSCTSSAAEGV